MYESLILGLLGIGILVIINIAMVAFSYGKLSQKVSDTCRRIDRLEKIINGDSPGKEKEGK